MADITKSNSDNGVLPQEAGTAGIPPAGAKESKVRDKEGPERHFLVAMSSSDIDEMSPDQIRQFYEQQLNPYREFVFASANRNKIPPQLLAAILLTELSDIGVFDVIQDDFFFRNRSNLEEMINVGSIGIAQIQVKTAVKDSLTLEPGESKPQEISITIDRLFRPRSAIEAAAREIRLLLGKMVEHRNKPWQKSFGFNLPGMDRLVQPDSLYTYILGETPLSREQRAALLLAGAYNSPAIITATAEEITEGNSNFKFSNAIPHASNASVTAGRLFQEPKLFH
jgi:hypothetical protein